MIPKSYLLFFTSCAELFVAGHSRNHSVDCGHSCGVMTVEQIASDFILGPHYFLVKLLHRREVLPLHDSDCI